MGLFGKIFGNDDIPEVDPLLRRAIEKQKQLRQDEFWKGYAEGYKQLLPKRFIDKDRNTLMDPKHRYYLMDQIGNIVSFAKDVEYFNNSDNEIWKLGHSLGALSAFFKYLDFSGVTRHEIIEGKSYTKHDLNDAIRSLDSLELALKKFRNLFERYPEVIDALYKRAVHPMNTAKRPITPSVQERYVKAISVLRR